MIHAFLVGLGNGHRNEENKEHQNIERALSAHPMFQELEEAIGAMERHIAEASFKHRILLQLRRDILESFGIKEKPESEMQIPKKETKKPGTESPPAKEMDPRLAILEDGIKKVIKILKKAPALKRFKSLRRPLRILIDAMKKAEQDQTETERIVQMEAAIGEGLNCLQNSKMALRSNVLKEIKKILEETIERKNQAVK